MARVRIWVRHLVSITSPWRGVGITSFAFPDRSCFQLQDMATNCIDR